jgi:hypothetical protein
LTAWGGGEEVTSSIILDGFWSWDEDVKDDQRKRAHHYIQGWSWQLGVVVTGECGQSHQMISGPGVRWLVNTSTSVRNTTTRIVLAAWGGGKEGSWSTVSDGFWSWNDEIISAHERIGRKYKRGLSLKFQPH